MGFCIADNRAPGFAILIDDRFEPDDHETARRIYERFVYQVTGLDNVRRSMEAKINDLTGITIPQGDNS
jgi:hypothetical protein